MACCNFFSPISNSSLNCKTPPLGLSDLHLPSQYFQLSAIRRPTILFYSTSISEKYPTNQRLLLRHDPKWDPSLQFPQLPKLEIYPCRDRNVFPSKPPTFENMHTSVFWNLLPHHRKVCAPQPADPRCASSRAERLARALKNGNCRERPNEALSIAVDMATFIDHCRKYRTYTRGTSHCEIMARETHVASCGSSSRSSSVISIEVRRRMPILVILAATSFASCAAGAPRPNEEHRISNVAAAPGYAAAARR